MHLLLLQASLVAHMVKNRPAMRETWVRSLCWEDPWRRAWQPIPVFLPGESRGQRSLVGYSPWGRKELDTTERLTLLLFTYYYYMSDSRLGVIDQGAPRSLGACSWTRTSKTVEVQSVFQGPKICLGRQIDSSALWRMHACSAPSDSVPRGL